MSSNTLSVVSSRAPMWRAEAAIHKSLAWAGAWNGCPAERQAKRSSATLVTKASETGTTVVARIDRSSPSRRGSPHLGDQGAVAELGHGDCCQEDLVSGHQTNYGL